MSLENYFMQMFCGYDRFFMSKMVNVSRLKRLGKKVGVKFFQEMEERRYRLLIACAIIRVICPQNWGEEGNEIPDQEEEKLIT